MQKISSNPCTCKNLHKAFVLFRPKCPKSISMRSSMWHVHFPSWHLFQSKKSLYRWRSLHAQVSCWRCLSGTSSDRRDRKPPEEEVHGGQEGLEEADGAESRASVRGEVYFVEIWTRRCKERLLLTGRHWFLTNSHSLAALRRLSLIGVCFVGTWCRGVGLE